MVKITDELSNEDVKSISVVDLLFSQLIYYLYKDKRNFDFSILTVKNCKMLNIVLMDKIEDFVAREVLYSKYKMVVR